MFTNTGDRSGRKQNIPFWNTVIAQLDQDIASNTTPATDNELFFSMLANKLYTFELYLLYSSPAGAGTPDIKWNFAGPATLTGQLVVAPYVSISDSFTSGIGQGALTLGQTNGTATTPRYLKAWGWAYSTGGGSGSSGFQFQWSQNTSGLNPTRRLAGSVLRYRQMSL